jgi:signal transduction histidine kinase
VRNWFSTILSRTRSGELWFATARGIVVVDPQQTRANSKPPAVYIEEVEVDGKTIPLSYDRTLQLSPGTTRLAIRYTGLDLAAPSKVRFRYRLEGFEANWVQAVQERRATYTHLPPGRYRFHVTAVNNDGIWNNTGDSLALVLKPFFWQTVAFQVVLALTLLGGTAILVRWWGRKRHQQRMETLERRHALELERSRIARDMHDGLGASVVKIAMLGESIESSLGLPEQARPRLHKLTTTARQLVRDMDEVVWSINPKNDTLEGLAGYMAHFACEHFADTGWNVISKCPPNSLHGLSPPTSDITCFLRLRNPEQHPQTCRGHEAWIKLELEGTNLRVQIRDNGCGGAAPSPPGRGNGKANMSEHLALLDGRFDLQAKLGEGTLLTMTIPLRSANRRL